MMILARCLVWCEDKTFVYFTQDMDVLTRVLCMVDDGCEGEDHRLFRRNGKMLKNNIISFWLLMD